MISQKMFEDALTGGFLEVIKPILPYLFLGIAFVFIRLIVKLIKKVLADKKIVKSGIREIDKMDGITFELYLAQLFKKLGYKSEVTKPSGDFGADLVVSKDGIKYVVQAKRYRGKVGISSVQEIVAAKAYYKSDKGIVFTNSFFTKPAVTLAQANDIELWDRPKLINFLSSLHLITQDIYMKTMLEDTHRCFRCQEPVSEKVYKFCVANKKRFKDEIYCYICQRTI